MVCFLGFLSKISRDCLYAASVGFIVVLQADAQIAMWDMIMELKYDLAD